MRKFSLIALLVLFIASAAVAKDKKQYVNGRLIDVRTQEVTSNDLKKSDRIDELASVRLGSPKIIKYTRYSIILSTDAEMFYLNLDRESTGEQPEFKNDMDVKLRDIDKDYLELLDGRGKKFTAEILRRVTRDAPTLKAPPREEPKPAN